MFNSLIWIMYIVWFESCNLKKLEFYPVWFDSNHKFNLNRIIIFFGIKNLAQPYLIWIKKYKTLESHHNMTRIMVCTWLKSWVWIMIRIITSKLQISALNLNSFFFDPRQWESLVWTFFMMENLMTLLDKNGNLSFLL